MKFSTLIIYSVIAAVCFVTGTALLTGGCVLFAAPPSAGARHVSGEIIIKFKTDSSLGPVAQSLFEEGTPFASVTGDGYLDELNEQYGLSAMEKLIKDTRSVDEIKEKYPQRAKRMPPGAQIPDLSTVYRIVLENAPEDINAVCRAYAKDPNVEYAQPNRIVTIQQPGS